MAQIIIKTSEAEQAKVLKVLLELRGAVTPVSTIAKLAGLKQTRTRYIIMDLVEQGRVTRVATKAFNKHYVRYSYTVNM